MLIHVDADCFFVSVERRHRPELHGLPVVVADQVVTCASYEARAFGVRGGQPTRQALRRCPHVVVVPVREDGYEQAGHDLMELLRSFTPWVEPASVEEAFLGFDDDGDRVARARAIREQAWRRLGLPVSVGVGRTKLIAKLASRRAKPHGLVVADPATEARVRAALRFEDIWGVGPTSVRRLHAAGLRGVADLAHHDEERLAEIVPRAMARKLLAICRGDDDATIRLPGPRGSASAQRTVSPPTRARTRLLELVGVCAEAVAGRLEGETREPTTIGLGVRFDDFTEAFEQARWPGGPVEAALLLDRAASLLDRGGFLHDGRGINRVAVRLVLPAVPPELTPSGRPVRELPPRPPSPRHLAAADPPPR